MIEYYIITFPIYWILCYSLFFIYILEQCPNMSKKSYKEDLKNCIIIGLLFACLNILGLIFTLYLIGFSKYGCKLK